MGRSEAWIQLLFCTTQWHRCHLSVRNCCSLQRIPLQHQPHLLAFPNRITPLHAYGHAVVARQPIFQGLCSGPSWHSSCNSSYPSTPQASSQLSSACRTGLLAAASSSVWRNSSCSTQAGCLQGCAYCRHRDGACQHSRRLAPSNET
jgi:hypothetical protein